MVIDNVVSLPWWKQVEKELGSRNSILLDNCSSEQFLQRVTEVPFNKKLFWDFLRTKVDHIAFSEGYFLLPNYQRKFYLLLNGSDSLEEQAKGLTHEVIHGAYLVRGNGGFRESDDLNKVEDLIESFARQFCNQNQDPSWAIRTILDFQSKY